MTTRQEGKPAFWNAISDVMPFPIYVVDVQNFELLDVNSHMRRKRGAEVGQLCYAGVYGKDSPCIFCPIAELLAQGKGVGASVVFEHYNDIDDGWYQLQETMIPWFDGRIVKYSIAVDINGLKEAQNALAEAHAQLSLKNRELERLATTDNLTGLNNRRRLDDVLASETERAKRYGETLSVLLLDIDRFKAVNDGYGHQIGDLVLHQMADILKHGVRKVDTAGRWGGEEFMVICPNTSASDAGNIAEKLRHLVERHDFPVVGGKTSSFGVAQYVDGEPIEKLIARADAALYRAKAKGRNRVEIEE